MSKNIATVVDVSPSQAGEQFEETPELSPAEQNTSRQPVCQACASGRP